MLSRITARSFFALLCLWVAALAVLASPLPPSTPDSKEAAPVFFGPPQPPVTVDLQILISCWNTAREHFLIAIGDTIIHVNNLKVIPEQENTLTPDIRQIPLKIAMQKYTPEFIGKASFIDDRDRQKFIGEMLTVKMPRFSEEGTCLDYIMIVLRKLKDHGGIADDSVLGKYQKIYDQGMENYRIYHT
ncbi:hypothetical protein LENED_006822 [Lentinula edodes]|uniref:Uncharacterized protein n=1 Tax=Lentinula edodes TaxID=5353 RepID=A0A1Q3ECQ6_LENED|nr:hypothetical protein LENED_006822 [Lentinula edodes]